MASQNKRVPATASLKELVLQKKRQTGRDVIGRFVEYKGTNEKLFVWNFVD